MAKKSELLAFIREANIPERIYHPYEKLSKLQKVSATSIYLRLSKNATHLNLDTLRKLINLLRSEANGNLQFADILEAKVAEYELQNAKVVKRKKEAQR